MKYSASDGSSLVEETRFLTTTDTTSYPIADITRSINGWYRKVAIWILQSAKDWQFDDANSTDLPIATTNLVADQKDYALPSTALEINRLEFLDNDGNWHRVVPIDEFEVNNSINEFCETSGSPRYYDIKGQSIFLYPAPATANITATNGLKVYFNRTVSEFTTSDTTKEPGFVSAFHQILSYGAAYDFLLQSGDTNRANVYFGQMQLMKKDLMDFYAGRHKEKKLSLKSIWRRTSFR